jgi:hypothetical protein
MANLALIQKIKEDRLPDNAQWTNRFKVRSATSNRVYIIAQNKSGRWWGCSCMGWIRYGKCKHQNILGLPGHHRPFEITEGS